jgi:hypothetical protein
MVDPQPAHLRGTRARREQIIRIASAGLYTGVNSILSRVRGGGVDDREISSARSDLSHSAPNRNSNAAGQGNGSGAVTGQVIDQASGTPLPGADLNVEGSVVSISTDRDGY